MAVLVFVFFLSGLFHFSTGHFLLSSVEVVFAGELASFSWFGLASSLFSFRLLFGEVMSLAVSVDITGQGGSMGSVLGGGGLLVTPIPESKHQNIIIIKPFFA